MTLIRLVLCAGIGASILAGQAPKTAKVKAGAIQDNRQTGTSSIASLGQTITVELEGYETIKDKAPKFVPFIDGRPLKGLTPILPSAGHGHLRFDLTRKADNRAAWAALLGSPGTIGRTYELSVGPENESPIATEAIIRMEAFNWDWFWIWAASSLCLLALLAYLGLKTSLVRDFVTPAAVGALPAFSLGRCQIAWWTFLVVASYLFLFMVLGDRNSITPSTLVLLGISGATAVGAGTVDTAKVTQAAAFEAATGVPAPVSSGSKGLLLDLIGDEHGPSVHRLQMVVWTAVLSVVFVSAVYKQLAMPEFDATLLGLMGISSGAYVTLKLQEKK